MTAASSGANIPSATSDIAESSSGVSAAVNSRPTCGFKENHSAQALPYAKATKSTTSRHGIREPEVSAVFISTSFLKWASGLGGRPVRDGTAAGGQERWLGGLGRGPRDEPGLVRLGRLELVLREQPVEPPRQVPVALAEQAHHRGEKQAPNDGRVEEDGHRQSDAELLA